MELDPANSLNSGGRWYPTLVTLPNGDVLAVGGHPDVREVYPPGADEATQRHANHVPERYNAGSNSWLLLAAHPPAEKQTTSYTGGDYHRTHSLGYGKVFFATSVRSKNRVYDAYKGEFLNVPVINLPLDDSYHGVSARWTSVMLPLLHQEGFRRRVLSMGGLIAERIDLDADPPQWEKAGDRDWNRPPVPPLGNVGPRRHFVCPVILPDGRVFFSGGTEVDGGDDVRDANAVQNGEIYDPGIDWTQGQYVAGEQSWQTVEQAAVKRHYHSTALLMPDGSVWTAGSNGDGSDAFKDANGNHVGERRIEIYQPSYFQPGRPVISACPRSIGYVFPFIVKTNQASSIRRVALIRCGSVTHGFNPDQRYLSPAFDLVNSSTLQVYSPPDADVAPPGYYMLWILDDQDRPCSWASFIRICEQKAFISADISTYSVYEVEALGTPAEFPNALYLAYDGFLPDEVSTPTFEFSVPGMTATLGAAKYEGGQANKDTAQRIVFPCHITFTSTEAFEQIPATEDFAEITFTARMREFPSETILRLSKNPNPRMRDGDPHWLSIDLRAFSTRPGQSFTAGIAHGSGLNAPYDYIQSVLAAYNTWSEGQPHPFEDELPTDLESNELPVYSEDSDHDKIFDYAIARVRYVAPEDLDPISFRVFFRLWTTGWTALEYNTSANGNYRRFGDGLDATPLLGIRGGEICTIPCFSQPRSEDMTLQQDDANRVFNLTGAGAKEVFKYVGCWLDFNQEVTRFPLKPEGNGPFSGELKSIQELMRGLHQCLVAEIHFQPDPISQGATPASTDDLAQRNLLLDKSDNPGGFASHLVHHTFEIKPSPFPLPQQPTAATPVPGTHRLHPDELCIDWGNLPRDSHVTFYLPQVAADEVVRYASARQGPPNLARTDSHTIHCKVTDVGFIPIPGPFQTNLAGLMTIQLPPNLTKGQKFRIVVRQVDGRTYRVLGTTQFDIVVSTAAEILPGFERNLSVLKHIALSIPQENRWYPVFQRYIGELGDRVRALGGNPDEIVPSTTGSGRPELEPTPFRGLDTSTGKIAQLVYDCFGDFEGFILQECERTTVLPQHGEMHRGAGAAGLQGPDEGHHLRQAGGPDPTLQNRSRLPPLLRRTSASGGVGRVLRTADPPRHLPSRHMTPRSFLLDEERTAALRDLRLNRG